MSSLAQRYFQYFRQLNSGGSGAPATYPESIEAVGTPPLWYKFQGTSGTSAPNSGSLGSAWNSTFSTSNLVLGNTGQIGANEAIRSVSISGFQSSVVSPVKNFTALTYARLVYWPTAPLAPTSNQITSGSSQRALWSETSGRLMSFTVFAGGSSSDKLTSTQFPLAQWFWVFGRWDGATGVNSIRWGYNGQLISPALTTNTSGAVGSFDISQITFNTLRVGALIDEVVVWDTIATDDQLLDIVTLSGL